MKTTPKLYDLKCATFTIPTTEVLSAFWMWKYTNQRHVQVNNNGWKNNGWKVALVNRWFIDGYRQSFDQPLVFDRLTQPGLGEKFKKIGISQ